MKFLESYLYKIRSGEWFAYDGFTGSLVDVDGDESIACGWYCDTKYLIDSKDIVEIREIPHGISRCDAFDKVEQLNRVWEEVRPLTELEKSILKNLQNCGYVTVTKKRDHNNGFDFRKIYLWKENETVASYELENLTENDFRHLKLHRKYKLKDIL